MCTFLDRHGGRSPDKSSCCPAVRRWFVTVSNLRPWWTLECRQILGLQPNQEVLMHRSAFVFPILAGMVLAGCWGEDPADSGDAASAPTTTQSADPTESVDEPAENPTASPTTGAPTAVPEPPDTVWPDEVIATHGAQVWAVYLAVGSPASDAETRTLEETDAYLRSLGYEGSGIGSVGCDQGAAQSLGLDSGDNRVAVYFDAQIHAQAFVDAYERPDLGATAVITYCLD
jgi:hypothetical protein